MHELALTGTQHTLWLTGVIVGFVVVAAVAVLLSLLIYLIRIIDRRVVEIRQTLTAAAANTDDTALLSTVGGGLDAVLAEGLQHHLFLGRVLGKVKS
jgi:Na+-transporting methylmalonyl-CoA/oxaloacetate decarboxylase gamma subunit